MPVPRRDPASPHLVLSDCPDSWPCWGKLCGHRATWVSMFFFFSFAKHSQTHKQTLVIQVVFHAINLGHFSQGSSAYLEVTSLEAHPNGLTPPIAWDFFLFDMTKYAITTSTLRVPTLLLECTFRNISILFTQVSGCFCTSTVHWSGRRAGA